MAKNKKPAVPEAISGPRRPVSLPKLWLRSHLYLIYILAAIVIFVGVFIGIRIYNNANHPLTRFMSASAKDFNSSFTFDLQAEENGETIMAFKGAYQADPDKQELHAVYDADYGDYTYTGAVYSEDNTRVSGSLYKDQWRLQDCSEKVLNFFDFNTDYRSGSFDSASFLRFTDLTSQFNAEELGDFMKTFKNRMDGNDPLAAVTTETADDGSKTYTYDIDVSEFFDMVRDKGASIFFSAINYDSFCALYELNQKTVNNSALTFTYTVNGDGWLTGFDVTLAIGDSEYAVHCTMDDFGTAEVVIPEEFFNTEYE